ncbi:MAG: hypothetical protein AB1489_33255 [Acidobacteriota bacterium]
MAKKKKTIKRNFTLIKAPEIKLLTPEQDAELKRLIQEINGPHLKRKKERERYERYLAHLEHGPDLPPAA